jgi:hypothetical protein
VQDGIVHLVQQIAERRGATSDSGWDWIVQEPALAPLLPLIYYSVPDSVLLLSEAAGKRCARAYYQVVARNMCLYRELGSVLEELRGAEIPVIVLKGAALAVTLYPNIGLRPMSDVDLLVPRARLAEAVRCLKALGYVKPYPEIAAGLNALAGIHVHLRGGCDTHLVVELHWSLVGGERDRYAPSMNWFWEQTELLSLRRGVEEPGSGGELSPLRSCTLAPLLTLTPTAHLLYLAAHLMLQHGGAKAQLIWFYDIDLLIRREADRLDWDELLCRAREFRWEIALHAALQGAQERFGTPLPRDFLNALAKTTRLVGWKANPLQTRALAIWNFMASLDWWARLRFALAIAFPSPSYVRWRYNFKPEWLWPFCYPYRWLDILHEGLSTALKLAMKGGGDGARRGKNSR